MQRALMIHMALLRHGSSLPAATSLASLLVLGAMGCGPTVVLETTSDPGDYETTTSADESPTPNDTTTDTPMTTDPTLGEDTTDGPLPPEMDMGGPPVPTMCPAEAGDLNLQWTVTEPGAGRADSVAAGAGRVAWTTGEFFDAQLWVLDVDGNPQWDEPVPLWGGEGDYAQVDLAIDPAGAVVLAGSVSEGALLQWYDATGNLLADDLLASTPFDSWNGVALLDDGDAVAAGQSDDEMFVRRYTPDASPVWSQGFSENGANWASHVAVTPDGLILVSGHSNTIPGPVLLAYDGDGVLQWSHFDDDGSMLDIGWSVAADSQGRAWLAISSDDDTASRVERFDTAGNLELTIVLDFLPAAIDIDVDDAIVVAGAILNDSLAIVERRDANGELLARHDRPGRRAMGVAVDEDCHAYVAGYTNGGEAWLDKLR
jgi:hypothetical protein